VVVRRCGPAEFPGCSNVIEVVTVSVLAIALVVSVLAVGVAAAIAVSVDRAAQAGAWRRIAQERRWNSEQRLLEARGRDDHPE